VYAELDKAIAKWSRGGAGVELNGSRINAMFASGQRRPASRRHTLLTRNRARRRKTL
jgi:hypothetical protein